MKVYNHIQCLQSLRLILLRKLFFTVKMRHTVLVRASRPKFGGPGQIFNLGPLFFPKNVGERGKKNTCKNMGVKHIFSDHNSKIKIQKFSHTSIYEKTLQIFFFNYTLCGPHFANFGGHFNWGPGANCPPPLIGFLHFRPPKIYARKITTLENSPKAQNFFSTHSPPACQSAVF